MADLRVHFPWKNWRDFGYSNKLVIINWPSGVRALDGVFVLNKMNTNVLEQLIAPIMKYKEGDLIQHFVKIAKWDKSRF